MPLNSKFFFDLFIGSFFLSWYFCIFLIMFSQLEQILLTSFCFLPWTVALSSEEHIRELNDERPENFTDQPPLSNEAAEQSERCCWKNGIFSHEVLQDGETNFDSEVVPCKFMRKVETLGSYKYHTFWFLRIKSLFQYKTS